jgi:hypothetical protein
VPGTRRTAESLVASQEIAVERLGDRDVARVVSRHVRQRRVGKRRVSTVTPVLPDRRRASALVCECWFWRGAKQSGSLDADAKS